MLAVHVVVGAAAGLVYALLVTYAIYALSLRAFCRLLLGQSWALCSYAWTPPRAGEYALVVRATDGTGVVQAAQNRVTVPEGASEYHRVVARVE